MAGPTLRTVTRTQGNNQALKDGTVRPAGFEFEFEEVPVLVHGFRRMVRELAYDVSEMAITTYLCAKAHGVRFTALPIFLVRGFHHGAVRTSRTHGVRHPKELHGRRVGVNRGYTVTTGVWARGILHDEYGVDLDQVTWVLSGDEHVAAYQPPSNVVPMDPDADPAALVASGDLAAGISIGADHPDVVPLIDDPEQAGYAALRDRGLYPINHLIVVRDDLLAEHPHLARDIVTAFTESKARYVEALQGDRIDNPSATDRMYRQVMQITGADPLPYGIAPNRPMLEQLIRYAVDQHILDHPVPVESMFADGSHDLTG